VYFQYGTTTSYGTEVEAANSPLLASGALNQIAGQQLTGLALSTIYHFRVRAVNSVDEVFGPDRAFTTTDSSDLPNVSTRTPVNVGETDAEGGGAINSMGTSQVTAKGNCWATFPNPDLGDTCADGSGPSIGFFITDITGLMPNNLYYVRAYATNGAGTGWGQDIAFETVRVFAYVSNTPGCNTNTPCYTSVNLALGGVISGTEIRIEEGTYNEDVILLTDKNLTLLGGWNASFATQVSNSTVKSLTIEKGVVEIDRVILQNPLNLKFPNRCCLYILNKDLISIYITKKGDHKLL